MHDAATTLVERTNPDAALLEPFLIMLRSVSSPRSSNATSDAGWPASCPDLVGSSEPK